MELSQSKNINYFTKFMSKTNSKKFVLSIEKFSVDYSTENETPFLLDSIYETKIDNFKEIFSKNNYLQEQLKKKKIKAEDIIYMPPEELNPELYEDIVKKKKLEELRKNNQATTDAFTCKKCKCKKSIITEKQTRAGDEPATIYVTCTECGFCFTL